MSVKIIRALTPIFLGLVGGIVGIVVLTNSTLSDTKWAAGLGLASTAIGGACGIAQASQQNLTPKRLQGVRKRTGNQTTAERQNVESNS